MSEFKKNSDNGLSPEEINIINSKYATSITSEAIPNVYSFPYLKENDTLSREDIDNINYMIQKIQRKRAINLKRLNYYNSETIFHDLCISTPTKFRGELNYSLGLGKIVVDKITNPISFVEIKTDNQDLNKKIQQIVRANGYKQIVDKLFESAGIFGCSFLSVTKGAENEPDILLIPLTPLTATGILNQRTSEIEYGLSITKFDEKDKTNEIRQMIYYRPNDYVVIDVIKKGKATKGLQYTSIDNPFNNCALHLVANTPSITQPFGKSLLTKSIMEAIDSCVATVIRATISAEVSTLPQRYITGTADNMHEVANKMSNELGAIWGIMNAEGDVNIGQLTGSDFQAQMRQLAFYTQLISNETSIPKGELNVSGDTSNTNPASAESILAGRQALIERINSILASFTPQLNIVIQNIGLYFGIQTDLVEHRFSSEYKQTFLLQGAEILQKLASVMPNIVETDFVSQILGLTQREWAETREQIRRSNLQSGINAILDKIGNNGKQTSETASNSRERDNQADTERTE